MPVMAAGNNLNAKIFSNGVSIPAIVTRRTA
jgi:hypothetical protein